MIDYSKQTKIDKTQSIDERVQYLKYCAKRYELFGDSPIKDRDYDVEFAELSILSSDSFFDSVGGELDSAVHGDRIKHEVVMGSLSKSLSIEEFIEWFKSAYSKQDLSKLSFILEEKLDGLAISLLYKNGKLVQALTRGDGETGVSCLESVKQVKGVKLTIPCLDEVEIRSEIIKDRFDFEKEWKSKGYANSRNFAAGSLNNIDPSIVAERGLEMIAYEVVRKSFATESDKLKFLEEQGFPTLKSNSKITKIGLSIDDVIRATKAYMDIMNKNRSGLRYLIDGIVFKCNKTHVKESMGLLSGKKPKASRAIKFVPESAITSIIGIEYSVGKNGTICPIAQLQPISLLDTTVSKCTLYNCGYIRDYKQLKLNCKIEIVKSGDIIPKLVKVVSDGNKDIQLPTECPSCNTKLNWVGPNLVCNNDNCVAQLGARIDHFIKELDFKGIGMGIINRLTDINELVWEGKPIISSISELFHMLDNDRFSEHPFRKYAYLKEQFGEKTYTKIVGVMKSVTETSLPKLISAMSIGKLGSMAVDLCAVYPTLDDLDKATVDDISKIQGFGAIKATGFVKDWKEYRSEIETILKYIAIKKVVQNSDKLKDKKFCFTGSFEKTREEYQKMVTDNGGKNSSSVGKDVILVWDSEIQGGKYEKALKGGNEIISEKEFLKMIE